VRWEPSKMQVDHCQFAMHVHVGRPLEVHWKTDTKRAEANVKRCTWTWVPFQLLDLLHTTQAKKKRVWSAEMDNQPTIYAFSDESQTCRSRWLWLVDE
jgi:hypothetical protein